MKVQTLDEIELEWKIPERVKKGNRRKTSKLHQTAKMLLRAKYPNIEIYEEVPIPVYSANKQQQYLDFYLPTFMVAIEIHGKQHYEFNNFHYENQLAYLQAVQRDVQKEEWCKRNDIGFVVLKYNEIEDWHRQI